MTHRLHGFLLITLLACSMLRGMGSEPVKLADGSYQCKNDLYQATVDTQGRLASLKIKDLEVLYQGEPTKKLLGAAFVGGADSRTLLSAPNLTLEAGMVVARGEGLEISYRFRDDGIDFYYDVKAQTPWAIHYQRNVATQLLNASDQVNPFINGAETVGVFLTNQYLLRFDTRLYTHYNWYGPFGAPEMVSASYQSLHPGKSETHLRIIHSDGWNQNLDVTSITGASVKHLFSKGAPIKFTLAVSNRADQPFTGTLAVTVSDWARFSTQDKKYSIPVTLAAKSAGNIVWETTDFTEPIVAKVILSLRKDDATVLTRDLVFAYDVDHYRPPLTRPADFSAFWQQTLKEMRSHLLDLQIVEAPELSNAQLRVSNISFVGLEGRRYEGWLSEPKAPGKYPATIGARINSYIWPAPKPTDTVQEVSLCLKLPHDGLYRTGKDSRETAEFLDVYTEHIRAIDVLCTRPNVDQRRIVETGASRTGPAVIAAAALDHRVALVNVHVPTSGGISWKTDFYAGWGAPHMMEAAPKNMTRAELVAMLGYFDMVNFAPDVQCPVVLGLGLRDYDLSPTPGVLATYAYLHGDKALAVDPWGGHVWTDENQALVNAFRKKYLDVQ